MHYLIRRQTNSSVRPDKRGDGCGSRKKRRGEDEDGYWDKDKDNDMEEKRGICRRTATPVVVTLVVTVPADMTNFTTRESTTGTTSTPATDFCGYTSCPLIVRSMPTSTTLSVVSLVGSVRTDEYHMDVE